MATKKIVELGKKIPSFKARNQEDKLLKSSDYKGKILVLYFYPKDNTPGCTTEGIDFHAAATKLKKLNAVVVGVSRDSVSSHQKFCDKYSFGFDLLSDPDEELCALFDVLKMKNLYGRKFRGIERSTFLIDSKQVLQKEWRKVKVKGHVDEVLAAIADMD